MSLSLLQIRYLQVKRILTEGGLGTVLLPFLLLALSFASFKAYQSLSYAIVLIVFLFLLSLSLHLRREDKTFAQLHIHNWQVQMYIEYVLICFPFSFTALFTAYFYFFPLLLFMLILIPTMKYQSVQKTTFKNISKLFSTTFAIEWISGFRTSYLTVISLYILAIVTCWMRFVPLFMLWLLTISILNFYHEYEALPILKAHHYRAKSFLHQKLKEHGLYLIYFYIPILTINAFFNSDFIDINILFLLVQLALLFFAINSKYAQYIPAQQNVSTNIIVAMLSVAAIVPFLLPLPVIFAAVYYKKAIQNLQNYFHA